jgi:hypothetical protein
MENNIKTWKEILINYLLFMMILPFGGMMLIMVLFPDGGRFVMTIAMALGVTIFAGIFNLLKAMFYKLKGENKKVKENE